MRRWPAEWETQEAIWFTWPHSETTWPGEIRRIQRTFAKVIACATRYQTTRINAAEPLHASIRADLADAGAAMTNLHLHDHPSNDVWCRDHGATFVHDKGQLHAIDWHFNAWGGKFPPWDLDDGIAKHMADFYQCQRTRSPLFLEGGAIEGNGAGTVITTEAVALNPNRNPDWSKSEVEAELKRCLGAESIFWLPGGIEGDDTDGHIDDLTRFVAEDKILTAVEADSVSPNYRVLMENRERLGDLKTRTGSKVEIIDLPMPPELRAKDWRLDHLPASYANFLILNEAILVPTFDQPDHDQTALGIVSECFPSRETIGLDARDLVFEGGAIHCISQQVPQPK